MFRWSRRGEEWLAQDGDHWFLISEVSAGLLKVQSNRNESDFARLLRLKTDYDAMLAEILRLGPELEPHVASLKGLRMMRPHSVVETLFSFMCTSNNHISRITGMVQHLASYGEPHEMGFSFPSLEVIGSLAESELRADGFGYRAASIPVAANQILACGGERCLVSLRSSSYFEVRQFLLGLKGVGPKLADCICLFGFDFGESVPIDTHIWQAMTRLYFPEWRESALTHKKYDIAAKFFRGRFGELAGVAHQFLFVDNMINWRERKALESHTERS